MTTKKKQKILFSFLGTLAVSASIAAVAVACRPESDNKGGNTGGTDTGNNLGKPKVPKNPESPEKPKTPESPKVPETPKKPEDGKKNPESPDKDKTPGGDAKTPEKGKDEKNPEVGKEKKPETSPKDSPEKKKEIIPGLKLTPGIKKITTPVTTIYPNVSSTTYSGLIAIPKEYHTNEDIDQIKNNPNNYSVSIKVVFEDKTEKEGISFPSPFGGYTFIINRLKENTDYKIKEIYWNDKKLNLKVNESLLSFHTAKDETATITPTLVEKVKYSEEFNGKKSKFVGFTFNSLLSVGSKVKFTVNNKEYTKTIQTQGDGFDNRRILWVELDDSSLTAKKEYTVSNLTINDKKVDLDGTLLYKMKDVATAADSIFTIDKYDESVINGYWKFILEKPVETPPVPNDVKLVNIDSKSFGLSILFDKILKHTDKVTVKLKNHDEVIEFNQEGKSEDALVKGGYFVFSNLNPGTEYEIEYIKLNGTDLDLEKIKDGKYSTKASEKKDN
ncbi:Vmc-like lipoprotein signal peptide domain-containing protein [Ureaplasma canigenitalium]|uniref:Vmc-like lipoprotein signal peptide domain-containing protein n=1 Tax=Ureaplasma canigenitalium TaxID=42092 RepID=UPI00068BA7EA|nr:hypothetical protein [Ureaplasma canigenitalium]